MTENISNKYRPCVGIALFNNRGQVFVGERLDNLGSWQMPQGGVDEGEDIKTAAFRELKEETGTDKASIIRIHSKKLYYDLPPELCQKLWGGGYKGQEQTWVALQFEGNDSDIDINADDIPEFNQWKWVNLKDTLETIVPFKRDIYRQLINAFEDIGQSR